MNQPVVVTGGSGVVGAAVVRHLIESGITPRCLARSDGSARQLAGLGAEPVTGDILDPGSLGAAVRGAGVVYHVAGLNAMCPADPAELYRVNVEGSRNVVAAARGAGVERLVYTSSAATIGEPRGSVGTEDTGHRGSFLSHYERSKYQAEEVVRAEAEGLDLVVVNPSSVQGPGRATGTGKLIVDLVNGKLPALVRTRLSIVDIDDCARGHLLAAAKGTPGERYILNGFTLEMTEAVEMLENILGRRLGVRFVPGWVATIGGTLVELGAQAAGKRSPVCREMVRTLRHGHAYDGSKATRELGLEYTGPEELLGRLAEWFRTERLIET